nr:hypothetical protein [Tanacetum cinerariifolium]
MSAPAKLAYLRVLQVDPSKRQFAFVSYKLAKDAKDAQYEIDGTTVGGRAISVQISEHGPDKDPLCNTMRDMARKYRDEIFSLPEQEQRRTRPNKINRYTRSDYAAEEEAADGKKENAATVRVEVPKAKDLLFLSDLVKSFYSHLYMGHQKITCVRGAAPTPDQCSAISSLYSWHVLHPYRWGTPTRPTRINQQPSHSCTPSKQNPALQNLARDTEVSYKQA